MLAEDGTLGILVLHVEGVAAPCILRLGSNRVKQRAGRRAGRQLQSSLTKSTTFGLTLLSTFLLCFARPQVENVAAEHQLTCSLLPTADVDLMMAER